MRLKRKRESESSLTPGFQPEQLQLMEMEMTEMVGAAGGELREVDPRVPAGMKDTGYLWDAQVEAYKAWSSGRGPGSQTWEHLHMNSKHWIPSSEVPKGGREGEEKKTKDGPQGQHTSTE